MPALRALAVVALLTLTGPALATPAGKDGPRKETPAEALRKALDVGITLELNDTPLDQVINQLADLAKVTIVLDRNAALMIADPSEMMVTLKAKDMKLRTALRNVASQHSLSFGIVGDHIFISSEEMVNFRQLRQRVNVAVDGVTLTAALKDLAQQTATNLVIDPRSLKTAGEAKIVLQLDDVPLETVVRLMAEMGGLKPVRLGNVMYVTTEDRAEKLRSEAEGTTPMGPREITAPVAPAALPVGPGPLPAVPAPPPPAMRMTRRGPAWNGVRFPLIGRARMALATTLRPLLRG